MQAIQLQAFGKPADVVKLVDVPDVGAPAPDEVVIALEASPVNATDLMIIAGRYGFLPQLPSILGIEGVGRVVAAGKAVTHLKEGDRTLVPMLQPAWTERIKTNAPWLRPLPQGDLNQFAMLGINPATAYVLLTDIVRLNPGDWVIQNGANSATGRAVIAVAKSLGIRTINVVRRPELVAEIKALGGDIVLVDGPDLPKQVSTETGRARIGLALDMVADSSTLNLMNVLADSGVVVVYSAMSGKPLLGSAPLAIFRNLSIRGFWLFTWYKTATPEKLVAMYEHLSDLMLRGVIAAPIAATHSFDQFGQALATAAKFSGKVILKPA
ncbi:MAG TPA: zinc-dependent alcohol dehydrogenase family protein [Bradyrhizobium sp.]|nr:zinc-dependent alcohol dehydrogenase family protein [Bradyrhizobium sp.]